MYDPVSQSPVEDTLLSAGRPSPVGQDWRLWVKVLLSFGLGVPQTLVVPTPRGFDTRKGVVGPT